MKNLLLAQFAQTDDVLQNGGIRLRNILMRIAEKHPTWTVENLCAEETGYDEVTTSKNCGRFTLEKLTEVLAKHGLFFEQYPTRKIEGFIGLRTELKKIEKVLIQACKRLEQIEAKLTQMMKQS